MIKSILVPAPGGETDAASFAAALAVARRFAAHIDALHVRFDPVEIAVATAAGDGTGAGGAMLQELIDQLEQDAQEREAKARATFAAFCAREVLPLAEVAGTDRGVSAQWHVETGQEARWIASYGITADLIVASRGAPNDDAVARSTLEALLLETGRPLLIPAAAGFPAGELQRIAIGWKATPQAAHAIAGAMPFLTGAKEVRVMTVEEESGRRDDDERLVRYLAWHGVSAVAERLTPGPQGAAETLVAAAAAASQLLVMGGYGHTRLREWVFGGFTQRVLAEAPLAVLLAH
jgi:nucleotide-binding universal stress UspA family protein